jgi:hypothetical protein
VALLALASVILQSVLVREAVAGQVGTDVPLPPPPLFHIVREPVAGGGELLTVVGRPDAGLSPAGDAVPEIPLVSVLRDTLGDADSENDRLRHVWVHGYTTPSVPQRIASAVPFLNRRVGNKPTSGEQGVPPSVLDLAAPERDIWKHVMWTAAQYAVFDPYGVVAKTSVRAFRRNQDDYRKAHIIRALAVLSLYEAETGADPVLSPVEMREIQARLVLAQRSFGGIIDDAYLQRAYQREATTSLDLRGHNWELLRQRAEEEGLYFEPLAMPDSTATHALVWVARADVADTKRRFNSRFLNIRSPWGDERLLEWTGYIETRYLDEMNQPVPAETPGAHRVELIPLALYGLDHPKIPAVLVDFRDRSNPKRRELSRRVLNDVTRNVLSLSPYGDLQYFLGKSIYNFITGRRGMDINQPSRLRSYSQLKLLLSLSSSLDPELAAETTYLVERVSMNPLQNDQPIETALAHKSYAALVAAAREPDGKLSRTLERDRRAEFASLEHGNTARILLRVATVATAGVYRHREDDPPEEQLARVEVSRRLTYHTRFLEEVVRSTPVIEVAWDIDEVRRSLRLVAELGERAGTRAANVVGNVFAQTDDFETQRLSLTALSRMGTASARIILARIHDAPDTAPGLRALSREYLAASGSQPRRVSDAVLASSTER